MNRRHTLRHEFVEYVPETLDEGVLYVSIPYRTVVHRCCCGCGTEIATPISPADWQLMFDGDSVSLYPSIGNWSLPCKSHYWIRENQVLWAGSWRAKDIAWVKQRDRLAVERRFAHSAANTAGHSPIERESDQHNWREPRWRRLWRSLRARLR